MDTSLILAAFVDLARAAEGATTDLSRFNKFAVAYQREKERQRAQAWVDTYRSKRRPIPTGRAARAGGGE